MRKENVYSQCSVLAQCYRWAQAGTWEGRAWLCVVTPVAVENLTEGSKHWSWVQKKVDCFHKHLQTIFSVVHRVLLLISTPVVWICHNSFIHSVEGHLGYFWFGLLGLFLVWDYYEQSSYGYSWVSLCVGILPPLPGMDLHFLGMVVQYIYIYFYFYLVH